MMCVHIFSLRTLKMNGCVWFLVWFGSVRLGFRNIAIVIIYYTIVLKNLLHFRRSFNFIIFCYSISIKKVFLFYDPSYDLIINLCVCVYANTVYSFLLWCCVVRKNVPFIWYCECQIEQESTVRIWLNVTIFVRFNFFFAIVFFFLSFYKTEQQKFKNIKNVYSSFSKSKNILWVNLLLNYLCPISTCKHTLHIKFTIMIIDSP